MRLGKGINGHRSRLRDLCEDSLKGSRLKRITIRDGDRMRRRSVIAKADVTALPTDDPVAGMSQEANEAIRGEHRAATSCGFDRDQLVFHIVQLHQSGMR